MGMPQMTESEIDVGRGGGDAFGSAQSRQPGMVEDSTKCLGLIAGNGRFPFLLLDAARAHGLTVVVAAIKEETDPEIDARSAADPAIRVHWLSLGELSKLIETFQAEGVTRAVMAGQVRHTQIFSAIRPDWRLAKLLLNLRARNTDMLLGAVAKVLADEGIELISSTHYLEPLLAKPGILTRRAPAGDEQKDIAYGRTVARAIAEYDLGQTVVIAAQACVAVEAMEGTDATIERAGALMRRWDDPASTLSRALTVVKVAKPKQDMRFDVPVIGVATIKAMVRAGATCLAIESGRTLLFDSAAIVSAADAAGIAIVAEPAEPAANADRPKPATGA
jgi:UDP-2,3-diacylglucosamine hydrolase